MGRSLFQRNPTECGVSVCDLETLLTRRPKPQYGRYTTGEKNYTLFTCWHGSYVGVIYSTGTTTAENEKTWQTHIKNFKSETQGR
jgi:hypothetical protein